MRKRVFLVILLVLLISIFVTACGNSSNEGSGSNGELDTQKENHETSEENDEVVGEKDERDQESSVVSKSVEEYKEIIDGTIASQDGESFSSVKVNDNKIEIYVELKEHETFSLQEIAMVRFSSITDALLDELEDIEEVTIKFEGVGEISLSVSQATISEYGSYFDTKLIEENFIIYDN